MKTNELNEKEALTNFANSLGLTVHKYYPSDCRKKMQWFLCLNGTSISPKLDYNGMNNFMLGYNAAKKSIL